MFTIITNLYSIEWPFNLIALPITAVSKIQWKVIVFPRIRTEHGQKTLNMDTFHAMNVNYIDVNNYLNAFNNNEIIF